MPFGKWDADDFDWEKDVSGPYRAKNQHPTSARRTIDRDELCGPRRRGAVTGGHDPKSELESFGHVLQRTVPLLEEIGELRRSKTAPGGSRGLANGSPRTQRLPEDAGVDTRLTKVSGRNLRKWAKLDKLDPVPTDCLQYALPPYADLNGIRSEGDLSPLLPPEACPEELSKDEEEEQWLNHYSVTKFLANTNLTAHGARDALTKLEISCQKVEAAEDIIDGAAAFTKRYFHTCHMYGNMMDQVRDIVGRIRCLDIDLDENIFDDKHGNDSEAIGAFSGLIDNEVAGEDQDKKKRDTIMLERDRLSLALRAVWKKFEDFHWDVLTHDFKRWIQSAELSESILREFLEQVSEQEKDVLSLLSLSRYIIEESLGMHVIHAGKVLTDFHELIVKQVQRVAQLKKVHQKEDDEYLSSATMQAITSRVEQLTEDRERHMRQLEVNRSLYQHMVGASGKAPGGYRGGKEVSAQSESETSHHRRSVSNRRSTTTVVQAAGWNAAGEVTSNSAPNRKSKVHEVAEARKHVHVEHAVSRCLMSGKSSVDAIFSLSNERIHHLEKIKRQLKRQMRAEHCMSEADILKNLPNTPEAIEIRWLLHKRRQLWQELNDITIEVNLSDFYPKDDPTEPHNSSFTFTLNGRQLTKQEAAELTAANPKKEKTKEQPKDTSKLISVARNEERRGAILSLNGAMFQVPLGDQDDRQAILKDAEEEDPNNASGNDGKASSQKGPKDLAALRAFKAQMEKKLDKLGRTQAKLEKKAQKMADGVNTSHGLRTWTYKSDPSRIWFVVNPRNYIVEALIDALEELVESSPDELFGSVREDLLNLQESAQLISDEFSVEKTLRTQCASFETPFDELAWVERTVVPLDAFLVDLQMWCRRAKKLGAYVVERPSVAAEQRLENCIAEVLAESESIQRLQAQIKDWEDKHMEGITARNDTLQETTMLVESKKNFVTMKTRWGELGQKGEYLRKLQFECDELVNKIQRVMEQRKQMHVEAMRSQVGLTGDAVLAVPLKLRQWTVRTRKRIAADVPGSETSNDASDKPGELSSYQDELPKGKKAFKRGSTALEELFLSVKHNATNDWDSLLGGMVGDDVNLPDKPAMDEAAMQLIKDYERPNASESESGEPQGGLEGRSNAISTAHQQKMLAKRGSTRARSTKRQSLSQGQKAGHSSGQSDSEHFSGQSDAEHLLSSEHEAIPENEEADAEDAGRFRSLSRAGSKFLKRNTIAGSAHMDKSNVDKMMEEAKSQGNVLKIRAERKEAELDRLISKMTTSKEKKEPSNSANQRRASQQRDLWNKRVQEFRNNIKTSEKMINFWKSRFEQWHQELLCNYGQEVVNEVQDEHRASHTVHERRSVVDFERRSMVDGSARPSMAARSTLRGSGGFPLQFWSHTHQGTDPWELTKESHVSKAFSDAFSALRQLSPNTPRLSLGHGSLGFASKLSSADRARVIASMGLGNQFGLCDVSMHGEQHHGPRSAVFGGGFALQSAGRKGFAPKMNVFNLGFGLEVAGKGSQFPRPGPAAAHLSRRMQRASVLNLMMNSPMSGFAGLEGISGLSGKGFGNRGGNRVFGGARFAGYGRMRKMMHIRKFNFAGDGFLPSVLNQRKGGRMHGKLRRMSRNKQGKSVEHRKKARDSAKGEGHLSLENLVQGSTEEDVNKRKETLKSFRSKKLYHTPKDKDKVDPAVEALEEMQAVKARNEALKRRRQSLATQHAEMAQVALRQHLGGNKSDEIDAAERLKQLSNRKRRRTILERDTDMKSNVSMLSMFMNDVKEGEQSYDTHHTHHNHHNHHHHHHHHKQAEADVEKGDVDQGKVGSEDAEAYAEASSSSSSSSSDSSALTDQEEGVEIKSDDPDALWKIQDEPQRIVRKLRSCRDKLIQRFGTIDKAYVKCTPAVLGMTAEVFIHIVGSMGYEAETAAKIYALIAGLANSERPKKGENRMAVGMRNSLRFGMQQASLSRSEFADAMRQSTTCKSLLTLRTRLRKKYMNLDTAFGACANAANAANSEITVSSENSVQAVHFRDFMAGLAVTASEAGKLFKQMAEHNDTPPPESGPPLVVTRHGFLVSLCNADALAASKRLERLLDSKIDSPMKKMSAARRLSVEGGPGGPTNRRGSTTGDMGQTDETRASAAERRGSIDQTRGSAAERRGSIDQTRGSAAERRGSIDQTRGSTAERRGSIAAERRGSIDNERRISALHSRSSVEAIARMNPRSSTERRSSARRSSINMEEEAERRSSVFAQRRSSVLKYLDRRSSATTDRRGSAIATDRRASAMGEDRSSVSASATDRRASAIGEGKSSATDRRASAMGEERSSVSASAASPQPTKRNTLHPEQDEPSNMGRHRKSVVFNSMDKAALDKIIFTETAAAEANAAEATAAAAAAAAVTPLVAVTPIAQDAGGEAKPQRRNSIWTKLGPSDPEFMRRVHEREKKLLHAFLSGMDPKVSPKDPIGLEDFRQAVRGFEMQPEDVRLLFGLADHSREHKAIPRDVIMRMLGGLGYKHNEVRTRFGLEAVHVRQKHRRMATRDGGLHAAGDAKRLFGASTNRRKALLSARMSQKSGSLKNAPFGLPGGGNRATIKGSLGVGRPSVAAKPKRGTEVANESLELNLGGTGLRSGASSTKMGPKPAGQQVSGGSNEIQSRVTIGGARGPLAQALARGTQKRQSGGFLRIGANSMGATRKGSPRKTGSAKAAPKASAAGNESKGDPKDEGQPSSGAEASGEDNGDVTADDDENEKQKPSAEEAQQAEKKEGNENAQEEQRKSSSSSSSSDDDADDDEEPQELEAGDLRRKSVHFNAGQDQKEEENDSDKPAPTIKKRKESRVDFDVPASDDAVEPGNQKEEKKLSTVDLMACLPNFKDLDNDSSMSEADRVHRRRSTLTLGTGLEEMSKLVVGGPRMDRRRSSVALRTLNMSGFKKATSNRSDKSKAAIHDVIQRGSIKDGKDSEGSFSNFMSLSVDTSKAPASKVEHSERKGALARGPVGAVLRKTMDGRTTVKDGVDALSSQLGIGTGGKVETWEFQGSEPTSPLLKKANDHADLASPRLVKNVGSLVSPEPLSPPISPRHSGRASAAKAAAAFDDEAVAPGTQSEEAGSASSSATIAETEEEQAYRAQCQAEQAQAYREQCQATEGKHNQQRVELFDGDTIELEIATRKLQELVPRLLAKFKLLGRAYDEIAGGHGLSVTLPKMQERLARILKYNPLDVERFGALVSTILDKAEYNYNDFLHLVRYATPVPSMLEFRKRLVQQYGELGTAIQVLNIKEDAELSVDTFEAALLPAGIVSKDSHRIFRVIDGLQWGGPRRFVTLGALRFAIENAHVLGWLEHFHRRQGGSMAFRSALLALPMVGAFEEVVLTSADQLEVILNQLGFPSEFVPPLFTLLVKRTPEEATLEDLVHVMQCAFDDMMEGRHHGTIRHTLRATLHAPSNATGIANVDHSESHGAGPSDASRGLALDLVMGLRSQLMQNYANFQEVYNVFQAARPEDGIALDEWEAAMQTFGYTDLEQWCLIFGHIIGYQHMRWDSKFHDSKFRGTEERVTLAKLATALNSVTPCQTLMALRTRLHEKCSTLPKAWIQVTGKENIDEISHMQWQKGLRQFTVTAKDASQLYAIFCATPSTEHHSDEFLSRTTFTAALKGPAPDAIARLLELLLQLSAEHGPVSRAFEKEYPREPLPTEAFQEQTALLLGMSAADSRVIFLHLSLNRDGKVAIDELLDALTVMQARYLPYAIPRPAEQNDKPSQPAESSGGTDLAEVSDADSSKRHLVSGSPPSGGSADIHNISTTLPPDSDDDSGSCSAADTQQARPRTVPSEPGGANGLSKPGEEFGQLQPRRLVGAFNGAEPGIHPVLDLAGWHQREYRPMTTDTGMRSTNKGAEPGSLTSRPAPLAMALRRLVEDNNHARDSHSPLQNSLQSTPLQAGNLPQGGGLHRDDSLMTLTTISDDTSVSRRSLPSNAAGPGLPSLASPLVLNGASSWMSPGDSDPFSTPKRETVASRKTLGSSPRMPHTGAKAPLARERVSLASLGSSANKGSDLGNMLFDDPAQRTLANMSKSPGRQLPGLKSERFTTFQSPRNPPPMPMSSGRSQATADLENSMLAQTLATKGTRNDVQQQQQQQQPTESGPKSQLALALASRLGSSQKKEGVPAVPAVPAASPRKTMPIGIKADRGNVGEAAASAAAASLLKKQPTSGLL